MRGREGGNATGGVDQFSCRVMIAGTLADDAARIGGIFGKEAGGWKRRIRHLTIWHLAACEALLWRAMADAARMDVDKSATFHAHI